MEPFNITFSKRHLTTFYDNLFDLVDNEYKTIQEPQPWKSLWDIWKQKGLRTANSRRKISLIVLGKYDSSTKVPKLMATIIDKICQSIPIVNETVTFTKSDDDPEKWQVTFPVRKTIQLTDQSADTDMSVHDNDHPETTYVADDTKIDEIDLNPEKDEWTNVPGKPPTTPTPVTHSDSSNRNAFDILADTIDDDDDDRLLSYDDSTNNESPSPPITNKEIKKTHSHQFSIEMTKNEIEEALNIINANAIDNDNIPLITKWILSNTTSHSEQYDEVTKTCNDMVTRSKQNFELNHTNLNTHANTIIDKIDKSVSVSINNIEKLLKDTTNEHTGNITTYRKDMNAIKNSLAIDASNAIANVNSAANVNKTEINELIKELNNVKTELNASQSVGKQSIASINTLLSNLRTTITDTYANYEDDVMQIIDNEKSEFRQWMDTRMKTVTEYKTLIASLTTEKDLCKAERLLMETARIEQQTWFDNIQKQFHSKPIQSAPHIPLSPPLPKSDDTISSIPNPSPSTIDEPPPALKCDTMIHYKNKNITDITGYIMNERDPTFKNGYWHYDIFTAKGACMRDCSQKYMTIVQEIIGNDITTDIPLAVPPPPPEPTRRPPTYDSPLKRFKMKGMVNKINFNPSSSYGPRALQPDEFEYPIGSKPMTVYANDLTKAAAKWDLKLRHETDLRGSYERLQTRMALFNIYLIDYDHITKKNECCQLSPTNCTNYNTARQQMSRSLFIVLEDNQDRFFEHYSIPKTFISAYRRQHDGFGLITHIMEPKHPNLKITSNRKAPKEPSFQDYSSIYEFLDAYIEWCEDEVIRADRHYTDREKIDHIRDELSPAFQTAKYKIKCKLDELDADLDKPFPSNLILNEKLAKYIVSLLPEGDKANINKVMLCPEIHKIDRPSQYPPAKKPDNNWTTPLKWEIIPGARCPACHKRDHNVYKTGCPELARFAVCKEFYDKTPDAQLQPVIREYKKYQASIAKKMKERRNNDRRTLRTLKSEYDDDDMSKIKESLFQEYKTDFLEDQYRVDNPLDYLDDEDVNENRE
jgi:hypothetical protein